MKIHRFISKMFKSRKRFNRRYACIIVIIVILCFGYLGFLYLDSSEMDEYQNNDSKIEKIEESIETYENHGECIIPDLPIDNPEIMKFYKKSSNIDCGNADDDWITCKKSRCFIKPSVLAAKGSITCSYTDLIRKSDYSVKHGRTTKVTNSDYILRQSDFAKVFCKTNDGERWYGMAIGIRDSAVNNIQQNDVHKRIHKHPLLNVLMLGFDSLSRNAFIRKLPNTYEYLTTELKALILNGYNIVGDGTPQALIPILTGQTELELPETRKRVKNSNYVDTYPLIWNKYKMNNYVTSFNEDIPTYGTFTYRLNGFKKQPTDHYMRTYYLEVENFLTSSKKFCINHQPSHNVMLNYTKNFMLKYSDLPGFIFSFHGELSHDSINLIGSADNDIKDFIVSLKNARILNNTILIVMSDHGNRFAEVRNTLQGKQEERLPFFSFTFPDWFKNVYTKEYNNFLINTNRLTTPFDINETLRDILRIQLLETNEKHIFNNNNLQKKRKYENRSISLFSEIPKTRSCADAYIEPHWCACLNWITINDTNSELSVTIAESVLRTINNATNWKRSLCEKLELDEINWLMKLKPSDNLLKFKQNKDTDGFLPDLTSQTVIRYDMYQIKITVVPGKSIFEASVRYDRKRHNVNVKLSDISRVNKYGSQANCIYDRDPELRKYCYCKK